MQPRLRAPLASQGARRQERLCSVVRPNPVRRLRVSSLRHRSLLRGPSLNSKQDCSDSLRLARWRRRRHCLVNQLKRRRRHNRHHCFLNRLVAPHRRHSRRRYSANLHPPRRHSRRRSANLRPIRLNQSHFLASLRTPLDRHYLAVRRNSLSSKAAIFLGMYSRRNLLPLQPSAHPVRICLGCSNRESSARRELTLG